MPQVLASAKRKLRSKPSRRNATTMAAGEPLALELVSSDRVKAFNALYRRRAPAMIEIAGQAFSIDAVWSPPNPVDQRLGTVAFTIGGVPGELRIPISAIDAGIAQADEAADARQLTPAHAALLLELAFAEELEWLEGRLGERIEIASVERRNASAAAPSFSFVVAGNQAALNVAVDIEDTAAIVRLGHLLDELGEERRQIPAEFPLPVCLWRDVLMISLGDLQSLQPNDVVLFEEQGAATMLVIADRFYAPVDLTAEGPQLLAAPVAIAGSKWEWTMNQNTPPPAGQTLEESSLDELPVALVFELGRTAMPLGEVRQLAPGAIVQLADVTRETVDIVANGKRVGRGEIVRIGESLGVRIDRMFDNA
ncbi:type III secretion protein Q [Mesorhizobium sp. YR577]|nr:type III secretion protein Q [Mesorhizobium sp. YR577]